MNDKRERKRLAILEALKHSRKPLSGTKLAQLLTEDGIDTSGRTIRMYLNELDDEGLTESLGKKGRIITEKGLEELNASAVLERVGFMDAEIDRMTYCMDFDAGFRRGNVVVNTAVIKKEDLLECLDDICKVFEKGLSMGTLVGLLQEGEELAGIKVPPGAIGLCTVCSITLNGVLLKYGIPMRSIFCGLLELQDYKPYRFAEIIHYNGSSVDPLQLFIKSRMTDYLGAITTGKGRIGVSFREMPAESYDLVLDLADKLERIGLGAFESVGRPGQALYGIPVREGCIGAVVIGGLNPVAVLEESGRSIDAYAIAGLCEFNKLFPFYELKERLLLS